MELLKEILKHQIGLCYNDNHSGLLIFLFCIQHMEIV